MPSVPSTWLAPRVRPARSNLRRVWPARDPAAATSAPAACAALTVLSGLTSPDKTVRWIVTTWSGAEAAGFRAAARPGHLRGRGRDRSRPGDDGAAAAAHFADLRGLRGRDAAHRPG